MIKKRMPNTFHHGNFSTKESRFRMLLPKPTPKKAPATPLISSSRYFRLNSNLPILKRTFSIFSSSVRIRPSFFSIFFSCLSSCFSVSLILPIFSSMLPRRFSTDFLFLGITLGMIIPLLYLSQDWGLQKVIIIKHRNCC